MASGGLQIGSCSADRILLAKTVDRAESRGYLGASLAFESSSGGYE